MRELEERSSLEASSRSEAERALAETRTAMQASHERALAEVRKEVEAARASAGAATKRARELEAALGRETGVLREARVRVEALEADSRGREGDRRSRGDEGARRQGAHRRSDTRVGPSGGDDARRADRAPHGARRAAPRASCAPCFDRGAMRRARTHRERTCKARHGARGAPCRGARCRVRRRAHPASAGRGRNQDRSASNVRCGSSRSDAGGSRKSSHKSTRRRWECFASC